MADEARSLKAYGELPDSSKWSVLCLAVPKPASHDDKACELAFVDYAEVIMIESA